MAPAVVTCPAEPVDDRQLGSTGLEVPVFYPTMDDMRGSFEMYIESIEEQFESAGICKIIPPKAWTPRKAGYEDVDFLLQKPIRQYATGRLGLFRTILVEAKSMSVKTEYKPMAEHPDCQPRFPDDSVAVEREFWKNITYTPPLYGADVEGSLFDDKCNGWNIRNLNTMLSRTLNARGIIIPGVTTPYLYFGMWRSTFAWHTEDMDLYSINYLHFGRPKSWFTIPPASRSRFETLVHSLVPDLTRSCPEFLRHKELIISPSLLKQHNIPVMRVTQRAREFIINFPGAYHSGYNHGFNCAESTNFGTAKWVPIGRQARACKCRGDTVSIDMDPFLPEHLRAKPTLAEQPRGHKSPGISTNQGGRSMSVNRSKASPKPPPKPSAKINPKSAPKSPAASPASKNSQGALSSPVTFPRTVQSKMASGEQQGGSHCEGAHIVSRGRPRKDGTPARPSQKSIDQMKARGILELKTMGCVSPATVSSVNLNLPLGAQEQTAAEVAQHEQKRGRGRPRKRQLAAPPQEHAATERPADEPTKQVKPPQTRATHAADTKATSQALPSLSFPQLQQTPSCLLHSLSAPLAAGSHYLAPSPTPAPVATPAMGARLRRQQQYMQCKTIPLALTNTLQGGNNVAPQHATAKREAGPPKPERSPCPPAPPACARVLSDETAVPIAYLPTPSGAATKGGGSAAMATLSPPVSPGGDARLMCAGAERSGRGSPSWAMPLFAVESCTPCTSETHVGRTASCASSSPPSVSAAVGSGAAVGAAAAIVAEVGPGMVLGATDVGETRHNNDNSMGVVPGLSAACSEVATWDGACERIMAGASSTETDLLPPTPLWSGIKAPTGRGEGRCAQPQCAALALTNQSTAVDEPAAQATKKARLTSPNNAFVPFQAAESCKLPKSEKEAACWVECYKCSKWRRVDSEAMAAGKHATGAVSSPVWDCVQAGLPKGCEEPEQCGYMPSLGAAAAEATPIGWQRWLTERRARKKVAAHKWEVAYRSPCGHIMRSRQEVVRFLSQKPQYCHLRYTQFVFDTRTAACTQRFKGCLSSGERRVGESADFNNVQYGAGLHTAAPLSSPEQEVF